MHALRERPHHRGTSPTEWGVAHLRGRSLADRARALIAVAHPDHREALEPEARIVRA